MQEQTHAAGLCRLVAMPLALLAQGTDPTVSDPSGVEYPQGAIMLGALHSASATSCLLDTSRFHRAGEQSPFPRSDQLSRWWQW